MSRTANLCTKIPNFGGFHASIVLISRGRIPRPIGISFEHFESRNLSRDNISREIGRTRAYSIHVRAAAVVSSIRIDAGTLVCDTRRQHLIA